MQNLQKSKSFSAKHLNIFNFPILLFIALVALANAVVENA
jgi:hypothetical protein